MANWILENENISEIHDKFKKLENKIVKDIIISYKGSIKVTTPTDGYNTCFEILIPKNN